MNKKFILIPAALALLLTACQSSGLFQPGIPGQTEPVILAEETTAAPEPTIPPETTAAEETTSAPETTEAVTEPSSQTVTEPPAPTGETPVQLELPILEEINRNVTIATAGAHLKAVQAAAALLDWGVNTGLDPEEIREATVSWLSGLENDARTAFVEKLTRVDEAYLMLLEDGAEDILSTAGVENSGYPWSDQKVETIEAIMEAAGLR